MPSLTNVKVNVAKIEGVYDHIITTDQIFKCKHTVTKLHELIAGDWGN